MEIATTMVRFTVLAENMETKTDKAIQVRESNEEDAQYEWIPKKKIFWRQDKAMPKYNTCIMPKWAFLKGKLPQFVKGEIEFLHRDSVEGERLLEESYENRNILN